MKQLLIATRNKGKLGEFSEFLSGLPVQLVSLDDIGVKGDVEEDQSTYGENSKKKALFFAKKAGLPAISDDGGIEIEFLEGAPGLKSRRWLGKNSTEQDIIAKMKKLAETLPDDKRGATFRTIVTLALPSGESWSVEGKIHGIIAKKPLLNFLTGYPYRSFFYLPEINKYYHEKDLTKKEETLYNHRYKAVQKLKPVIEKALNLRNHA